jgi:hypothetical protein
MAGDFKFILKRSERQGPSFNSNTSRGFNFCIVDIGINEISLSSQKFTWARRGSSLSMALLDKFFCDDSWDSHFPHHSLMSLLRIISDHSPLSSSLLPLLLLTILSSDLSHTGFNMRTSFRLLKNDGMRYHLKAMPTKIGNVR